MQDNADIMRHVIIVIIALLALSIFMPTIWAKNTGSLLVNATAPQSTQAYTPVLTTPSVADFLNDSWVPSSFVPPTITAVAQNKKGYVANTTYSIYDFANDTYAPPETTTPNYLAVAANNQKAGTGSGDIYQVLNPNWTPATPTAVITTSPYKMHQMG